MIQFGLCTGCRNGVHRYIVQLEQRGSTWRRLLKEKTLCIAGPNVVQLVTVVITHYYMMLNILLYDLS